MIQGVRANTHHIHALIYEKIFKFTHICDIQLLHKLIIWKLLERGKESLLAVTLITKDISERSEYQHHYQRLLIYEKGCHEETQKNVKN